MAGCCMCFCVGVRWVAVVFIRRNIVKGYILLATCLLSVLPLVVTCECFLSWADMQWCFHGWLWIRAPCPEEASCAEVVPFSFDDHSLPPRDFLFSLSRVLPSELAQNLPPHHLPASALYPRSSLTPSTKQRKNQNLSLGGYAVQCDSSDEDFELLPEKRQHCLPCVRRMLARPPPNKPTPFPVG